MTKPRTNISRLTRIIEMMMQRAIIISWRYFNALEQKKTELCPEYKNFHSIGDTSNIKPNLNWLKEGSITVNVFPGWREVCPNIYFDRISTREKLVTC